MGNAKSKKYMVVVVAVIAFFVVAVFYVNAQINEGQKQLENMKVTDLLGQVEDVQDVNVAFYHPTFENFDQEKKSRLHMATAFFHEQLKNKDLHMVTSPPEDYAFFDVDFSREKPHIKIYSDGRVYISPTASQIGVGPAWWYWIIKGPVGFVTEPDENIADLVNQWPRAWKNIKEPGQVDGDAPIDNEYIYGFFQKNKDNKDERSHLLGLFQYLDWREFEWENHPEKSDEILSWLYHVEVENQEDLTSILMMVYTGGLDGAYAQSYADVLAVQFMKSPINVVKALAEKIDAREPMEVAKVDEICDNIIYGCQYYEMDEQTLAMKSLREYANNQESTETERQVVEKIIKSWEKRNFVNN